MWWGGEEEGLMSGGSSSDNTTPPVDIMAEEAFEAASSFASEDVSDISDLKEQFAAQENLLGQLKNVLKSNEEKLQVKEKEVQVDPVVPNKNAAHLVLYFFLSFFLYSPKVHLNFYF